jgi:hypothetical protein
VTSKPDEWRGDWTTAETEALRAGLAATPEQRLEWLEEALRFAYEAGALKTDDHDPLGHTKPLA